MRDTCKPGGIRQLIKDMAKNKKRGLIEDIIKANRKKQRDDEIRLFGKSINLSNIHQSKKKYNRKKSKKELDDLSLL